VRVDTRDHLAVKLQDKPQHTVRGGVLGTKVYREIAEILLVHGAASACGRMANGEWRIANII